jgi:hypothetical protein
MRVVLDQQEVAGLLRDMRGQWHEATNGQMHQVTLDLEMLFQDLFTMIGVNDEIPENEVIRHYR